MVDFRTFHGIDIDQTSIDMITTILNGGWQKQRKVVPLVSISTDIGLPENSVDIMIAINTRMDIFFSTESDHSHDDTLCASTKRALKSTAVLHHQESSEIDALGPKELDRQQRENYLSCALK